MVDSLLEVLRYNMSLIFSAFFLVSKGYLHSLVHGPILKSQQIWTAIFLLLISFPLSTNKDAYNYLIPKRIIQETFPM